MSAARLKQDVLVVQASCLQSVECTYPATSVSNFERILIERRLKSNTWNGTKTAKKLDLERSHFYKEMISLGIQKPEIG